MERLAHHRSPAPTRKRAEPREIVRFLDFLYSVIDDSGKTLRLAFLVIITAAAIGAIAQLIRIDQQWIWVLLSALGVGGGKVLASARIKRRR
jgi:ABC-type amino acid transport system permease subunit